MPHSTLKPITLEADLGYSRIRVKLEAVGSASVRILEYYRRSRGKSRFQRRPREEGKVYLFSSLPFELSFEEAFAPRPRADAKRG